MSTDDTPPKNLVQWMGYRSRINYTRNRLVGWLFGRAILTVVGLIAILGLGVIFRTLAAVYSSDPAALKDLGFPIAALIGAPFVIWRASIAAKQARIDDESLFNDKINAAAEDLAARRQDSENVGSDDEPKWIDKWQDDLVTRAAAIDRLEGLAQERPTITPRVARMLSIYVRELSREHPAKDPPAGATPEELRAWAWKPEPIRPDMEKAAQTLGRLQNIDDHGLQHGDIDLRGANLQRFDLKGLNFDKSLIAGARMQGAVLIRAQMQGAELIGAQMEGAVLSGAFLRRARMQGAVLSRARMQGALLSGARMQGANLRGARMQGANLRGAQMQGAKLYGAQMQGAILHGARMQGAGLIRAWMQGAHLGWAQMDKSTDQRAANFSGASLWSVDYASVDISLDQVKSAFGDASVTLPNGVTPGHPDWPAHWPKHILGLDDFHDEWRKWRDDPDGYQPPTSTSPPDHA